MALTIAYWGAIQGIAETMGHVSDGSVPGCTLDYRHIAKQTIMRGKN